MNMYPLRAQILQLHSIVLRLGCAFVLDILFNTYPSPQLWDHRAVERQSHRMQMLHSDRTPYLEGQSVKIFLDKTRGETVAYTSSLGHRHLVLWAM
jgi:hypothetical protein